MYPLSLDEVKNSYSVTNFYDYDKHWFITGLDFLSTPAKAILGGRKIGLYSCREGRSLSCKQRIAILALSILLLPVFVISFASLALKLITCPGNWEKEKIIEVFERTLNGLTAQLKAAFNGVDHGEVLSLLSHPHLGNHPKLQNERAHYIQATMQQLEPMPHMVYTVIEACVDQDEKIKLIKLVLEANIAKMQGDDYSFHFIGVKDLFDRVNPKELFKHKESLLKLFQIKDESPDMLNLANEVCNYFQDIANRHQLPFDRSVALACLAEPDSEPYKILSDQEQCGLIKTAVENDHKIREILKEMGSRKTVMMLQTDMEKLITKMDLVFTAQINLAPTWRALKSRYQYMLPFILKSPSGMVEDLPSAHHPFNRDDYLKFKVENIYALLSPAEWVYFDLLVAISETAERFAQILAGPQNVEAENVE